MQHQKAEIEWRESGVPVSKRFDDPYFSLENGLAETRHVFLAGNDLPDRFFDGFCIAELGFGTGLNFLATLVEWEKAGAPGHLHYTGFEGFPMSPEEMTRALSHYPELAEPVEALVAFWAGGSFSHPSVSLEIIGGDARESLAAWQGRADAWFLDGFSPAKNPELWQPELMAEVAAHTNPGGTAATYTAAGFVRRGLEAAGFDVTRAPGYGRKRHMTRAILG
ncbi:tRNA (5-methylaminomethyl-2-thiouridine)(34)-methyltransferase MnmD [Phaeobacter sp. 22II1-1F12B]|uniref:tRNA (5-methylaminomethyl-2-thiouridine)(34)-methyltransferase MnmD n=1 Tax=Phaeobacter sp. 22II1-1F12B TaxID=1317111 RepID=UPI000B520F69|nr:tRNA (5-methylaminomethyl-2-thiouridine)(34)-methyltransferase MnmD [Phaeobacter sp. 22II1-1F12B]OWU82104.1 FAD-dependent oxidoreductase [Phaeobacter sp. 22II1-1F12B]